MINLIAISLLASHSAFGVLSDGRRDPFLWPFATTSIWNMPLGSGALYVPAGLPATKVWEVDDDRFVAVKATDPLVDWFQPGDWNKRSNGSHLSGKFRVPATFIVPDAEEHHTPNDCTAFLQPDGETVLSLEPTCRLVEGGPIWGWPGRQSNLYGDGIFGSHFGSGLSAIGGTIRKGEFSSRLPIRHALKFEVWGKYLYYGPDRLGFRWPADRSDSYAPSGYQGKNRRLAMGALLAIKPGVTAEQLGLETKPARILLKALQNYGAYLCDDSGWDAAGFCVEWGVREEFENQFGFNSSTWESKNDPWFRDMNRLLTNLSIVDNNSADSVGGGGVPRMPLAPAIERKS